MRALLIVVLAGLIYAVVRAPEIGLAALGALILFVTVALVLQEAQRRRRARR